MLKGKFNKLREKKNYFSFRQKIFYRVFIYIIKEKALLNYTHVCVSVIINIFYKSIHSLFCHQYIVA